MARLTDRFYLGSEWENVTNGNSAAFVTSASSTAGLWCVAGSDAEADESDSGHPIPRSFLWEASAEGQDLYVRSTESNADSTDYPAAIEVTLYP